MQPAEVIAMIVGLGSVVLVVKIIAGAVSAHTSKKLELRRLELDASRGGDAVDDLRAEMDDVRAHLGEVQERLDFTERLLAQTRQHDLLERGARDA